MIAAQKDPFLDNLLYRAYLRPSLRRHFHAIHAKGAENLRSLPADRSVIAYANHTNWWDGLVIFFLTRFQPRKEFYCMMDEKQLQHYRFFTWLGAFSVDQSNSLRAAGTVFYSLRLLKKVQTMLWIFPQGKMVNVHDRIEMQRGADFLAHRSNNTLMLPVAFRYSFFREQRPEILIAIGEPHPASESSVERIQKTLQELADGLSSDERSGDLSGFEILMKPGLSINKLWEAFLLLFRGRWREFKPAN